MNDLYIRNTDFMRKQSAENKIFCIYVPLHRKHTRHRYKHGKMYASLQQTRSGRNTIVYYTMKRYM